METIVDGYNMIFCCGWQGTAKHSLALERSRDRLISELAMRVPFNRRSKITIVFDAKTSPIRASSDEETEKGFQVVYARGFEDADSMIELLIQEHSTPKSLSVVSNDNRIKQAAMRRRATAIECDDWLDELEHLARESSNRDLQAKDTKDLESTDWLEEFGLSEDFEIDPESKDDIFNPFPPGYGEDLD